MSFDAWRLAQGWAGWLATASVHLAALVLLALALERLLARWWSPALASTVWGLAVVRMVLPSGITSPVALAGVLPGAIQPAETATGQAAPVAPAPGLLALWLLGIATVVLHDRLRRRRLTRDLRAAQDTPIPPHVQVLAGRIARELGLRAVPRILVTAWASTPAVVGVLRPTVLLPAGPLLDPRRGRLLEQALYHEITHVRRRDPLQSELLRLLTILYWFHPCAWIARSRLQQLAELGCDASVARTLGARAGAYREALLEVAARRLLGRGGLPGGAHGWLGRPALIVERLRALERRPARHPRLAAAAAFALLAPVLLPGASPARIPAVAVAPRTPRDQALEVLERAAAGERPGCFALQQAAIALMAQPRP